MLMKGNPLPKLLYCGLGSYEKIPRVPNHATVNSIKLHYLFLCLYHTEICGLPRFINGTSFCLQFNYLANVTKTQAQNDAKSHGLSTEVLFPSLIHRQYSINRVEFIPSKKPQKVLRREVHTLYSHVGFVSFLLAQILCHDIFVPVLPQLK